MARFRLALFSLFGPAIPETLRWGPPERTGSWGNPRFRGWVALAGWTTAGSTHSAHRPDLGDNRPRRPRRPDSSAHSGYLHDHVSAGAMVEARDPAGGFVLDGHGHRPAVLISNGIGITPMVAMAKAAAVHHRPGPVWFIHGSRNGRYHELREEIEQLVASYLALQCHIVYSRPEPADAGNYQTEGYLDASLVHRLVPGDADYYICGSPVFLEGMLSGLKQLGVPESSLFFEMFGGAAPMVAQPSTMGLTSAEVVFDRSDLSAVWSEADGTLLEFAEAQGLEPPFSCRAGVCGTCACRLVEGEVDTTVAPTATVPEGHGLLCISRPRSKRITLDL